MITGNEEMEAVAAAALVEAVDKLGGQAATARVLGVAQPSVWRWLKLGKSVPATYARPLEKELKERGFDKPDRFDLRPDLFARDAGYDHAAPIDLAPAR